MIWIQSYRFMRSTSLALKRFEDANSGTSAPTTVALRPVCLGGAWLKKGWSVACRWVHFHLDRVVSVFAADLKTRKQPQPHPEPCRSELFCPLGLSRTLLAANLARPSRTPELVSTAFGQSFAEAFLIKSKSCSLSLTFT